MALVVPPKREQNRYTGEKKNELRHGHGIYRYPNKFFRYEGEWKNGEKHGHGKLLLGDKGYYEGNFVRGEIEGHGFKLFGISGATYTGQFHLGEMHGQGLLMKPDGEQYEGSWSHNSREGKGGQRLREMFYLAYNTGSGILTCADGSSYEGEFHNNLKHGEGLQIYSNGDHFEGDWVAGKRHGHGMLRCLDGTLYDGQWKNDVYHGEGSISHASGITYNGMWYNGQPASKTVSLKLVGKAIYVEQGKTFSFRFECLDQNGEVCKNESGRSFKVSATKKRSNTHKFRSKVVNVLSRQNLLSESPTRTASLPTTKSSGVEQEYELLQIPPYDGPNNMSPSVEMLHSVNEDPRQTLPTIESGVVVTEQRMLKRSFTTLDQIGNSLKKIDEDEKTRRSPSLDSVHLHYDDQVGKKQSEEDIGRGISTTSLDHTSTSSLASPKKKKKKPVRDLNNSCETQSVIFPGDDDRKEFGSSEQRFLNILIKPSPIVTANGSGSCADLFLPPAPALDISHLLPGTMSADNEVHKSVPQQTGFKSPNSNTSSSSPRAKQKRTPSSPAMEPSPTLGKKKGSKTDMQSTKIPPKAEKLLQPRRDKYCAPGLYFLTLTEVTSPVYFDKPIVHTIEVTVTPSKHEKEVTIDRLLKSRTGKDSSDKIPGSKSKSRLSQLKT